jgi:hypothetical protein
MKNVLILTLIGSLGGITAALVITIFFPSVPFAVGGVIAGLSAYASMITANRFL